MSQSVDTDRPESGVDLAFLNRVPSWLQLIGFWSAVALVIATLSHSRMVAVEQPSQYVQWLIESLLIWNFWAVITPLVIRLGKWAYAERKRRAKGFLVLTAVGVIVAVVHCVYHVAISMYVMGESFDLFSRQAISQIVWFGPYALLIFAGLVAFGYAREYRQKWQENERAVRDLVTQLTQSQLDVLKAQLQPHFFFNTLNAISVLIRKGDTENAQAMLGRLGELLRYTLSTGERQMVPLREEVEFVRGYLEIEKARFGSRLEVVISVPENCLSWFVPPLLLQPVVENAVRHGIGPKPDGGTVAVTATIIREALELLIEDTGVGMIQADAGDSSEGLGLRNTRSRLERLYGLRSVLEFVAGPDGGTRVRILVPEYRSVGK